MDKLNWLLDTDSYKASHFEQYPPGMDSMFSYLEARGGKYPWTVFFGLQYLLKEYLTLRIDMDDVIEASKIYKAHGVSFNYDGWRHIAVNCGGTLPVLIKAIPEGSVIPTGNVLMTVESTDSKVPWVASWVETILERLWYPCNVATISRACKIDLYKALKASSDSASEELPFKLHDFGSRGSSSQESAALGGAAHLINFKGTDTMAGIHLLRQYYKAKDLKLMPGFSINASEHSTITSWGMENEDLAYENIINKYKDNPVYACVSDSYNLNNAIRLWGLLKSKMGKGMLVVRPDSGEPVKTIVETIERLDTEFGHTVNNKGYKVLNKVRVIQGDGINQNGMNAILDAVMANKWSITNVAFGMGGALLQKHDRDTQSFAYKCSSVSVNGKDRDVFKLAPGKVSKKGKLGLVMEDGKFTTKENVNDKDNLLEPVFLDGRILKTYSLDEVIFNVRIPRGHWDDTELEAKL